MAPGVASGWRFERASPVSFRIAGGPYGQGTCVISSRVDAAMNLVRVSAGVRRQRLGEHRLDRGM